MKPFLLFLLLFSAARLSFAQTATVTGTVKDAQGDPLHFAFVQDKQKHGTYTDSLGNFTIEASPNATIRVNCAGYGDTAFALNNRSSLQIVLNLSGAATGQAASNITGDAGSQTMRNTFRDELTPQSEGSGVNTGVGSILPTFNPKEETEGSRYLVKGWAHGYVVTMKDSTVQSPGFLYDYDKMGGGLLLSKDKRSAIEVNRDIVKSFTLYDEANTAYTFENVPQLNATHYVQVLASGNKYKIYKEIKTTFEKANFSSDGVMSQGHNYDLYKDEATYYVYDVQNNAMQKVTLKKKALKDAFAKDADKVNKFIADHSSDTIDDFYLSNLGSFMNE